MLNVILFIIFIIYHSTEQHCFIHLGDYVGYSYGETHCGKLTVKSNKGNELNIPYHGRTLEGDLVYEEQSLHFVMSKAIHLTSIIKTFSLLNNFSSTPVAISQIKIPKNATQFFKVIILI